MESKEGNVVQNIKNRFTDITLILDSVVQDGCSKKRPDICIDLGSHVIIVEVDENQHQNYSCENKRIMLLSEDFGFTCSNRERAKCSFGAWIQSSSSP